MKFKLMQIFLIFFTTQGAIASTSTAVLNLIGTVKPVAAISTFDLRSDFDLARRHTGESEKIGRILLKLNRPIEGIYLSSDSVSGDLLRHDGKKIKFSKPFTVHFDEECKIMNSDEPIVLRSAMRQVSNKRFINFSSDFNQEGLIEACDLMASWSIDLPNLNRSLTTEDSRYEKVHENAHNGLDGIYNMLITVTLVAQ